MTRPADPARLARLIEAVAARLGLQLDDAKAGLLAAHADERTAASGLRWSDWVARVAAGDPAELRALAERLTVGETYFFRNANDLRAFVAAVIPERIRARRGERRLSILSAGCSSGEEPYTLAMLLRRVPELAGWDLSIRGVDVNPAAIARARAGRYGAWSLRQTPPEMRARFLPGDDREVHVAAEVRALVELEEGNLVDEDPRLWAPGRWDVVFCRNVLMYFAPESTRRVIERIAGALAPGGYLFLGHAETLRGVSTAFHLRHTHGTFYYQLREGSDAAAGAPQAPAESPEEVADPAAPPADVDWMEAIRQASERIAALAGDRPAAPAPAPAPPAAPQRVASALELLRQDRAAAALAALGAAEGDERDTDLQLLRAVLLASSGDPAAAEAACARILELDELNAEAHYVKALCREHAGDLAGAANHDHYALYLDPAFAMPRLHLGLLAKRAGDPEAARRELSRALALLAAEDGSRILLLAGGFGRDALLDLCRAELRACGGLP